MKYGRTIWIAGLAATLLSGCFGKKAPVPAAGTSADPDKVLYDRATNDINHGHFTTGRLALQTLINTYPDSEYLAKAKLEIADSYYKEGGVEGLKQAIVEYKDFITFFPFLDEAAYAQLQVGMAHYRQMEKPDRDHEEAVNAEAELQTFLDKYPNNPLAPQAEQRLRETQEVLAEGNFRIIRFYYLRGAYKAAGARLLELTQRYPLYSQADQANWMLGQIYEKAERNDFAGRYYANIVRNYPLSPLVADAKAKLTKFGQPVPQPNPDALARMEAEAKMPHQRPGMFGRSVGMLKRGPDVTAAAHIGVPTMTPLGESGNETLTQGPPPTLGIPGASPGNSTTVETVTPGSSSSLAPDAASPSSGAESASTSDDAAISNPGSTSATTVIPSSLAATSAAGTSGAGTGSTSASAPATTPASGNSTQTGVAGQSAPSSTATSTGATQKAAPATSQESTSKKKKGLHKLIPF